MKEFPLPDSREMKAESIANQLYHNFIRPHEGLNGQTPAERAGIKVEGDDKWITLIQNASKAADDAK